MHLVLGATHDVIDTQFEGGHNRLADPFLGCANVLPHMSQQPVAAKSPFQDDVIAMSNYLATLMDNCTVSETETIPGRININEAHQH